MWKSFLEVPIYNEQSHNWPTTLFTILSHLLRVLATDIFTNSSPIPFQLEILFWKKLEVKRVPVYDED